MADNDLDVVLNALIDKEKQKLILRLRNALNQRIKQLENKPKKKYLKDIDIDLENSINSVFEQAIEYGEATKQRVQYVKMQFYNIYTRNTYIDNFSKNDRERIHLEKTYNSILNRVYKKWNNHVEYLISQERIKQYNLMLEKQKEQLEQQEIQQKKEKKWQYLKIIGLVLWNILKWTFLIGITLIICLFSILSSTKFYGGAIQKRKIYKPSRNFWNKG